MLQTNLLHHLSKLRCLLLTLLWLSTPQSFHGGYAEFLPALLPRASSEKIGWIEDNIRLPFVLTIRTGNRVFFVHTDLSYS